MPYVVTGPEGSRVFVKTIFWGTKNCPPWLVDYFRGEEATIHGGWYVIAHDVNSGRDMNS